MKIEKCDIITLGDGTRYTVTEILEHKNSKYVHLVAVDENEELLEEMTISKLVDNEKGTYDLEDIEDDKEFEEVRTIILEMFQKDYPQEDE